MSKKIGRGELDLSDGQVSSSEVDGRLLFLEAVAEHRIGAFYRLFSNEIQLTGSNGLLRLPRIDVSKLIRPGAGTDGPAGSDQTPLEALVASYRGQTSEMRVFGALLTWARTVNLRETWCIKFAFTVLESFGRKVLFPFLDGVNTNGHELDHAQCQLEMELGIQEAIDDALWQFKFDLVDSRNLAIVPSLPSCEFTYLDWRGSYVWNPFRESRKSFELRALRESLCELAAASTGNPRVKSAFRVKIRKYTADILKMFPEKPPRTPRKNHDCATLHFQWLVEYQIPSVRTYGEIGRESYADKKTVSGAIKRTAKLIGLSLRSPSGGGRPLLEIK